MSKLIDLRQIRSSFLLLLPLFFCQCGVSPKVDSRRAPVSSMTGEDPLDTNNAKDATVAANNDAKDAEAVASEAEGFSVAATYLANAAKHAQDAVSDALSAMVALSKDGAVPPSDNYKTFLVRINLVAKCSKESAEELAKIAENIARSAEKLAETAKNTVGITKDEADKFGNFAKASRLEAGRARDHAKNATKIFEKVERFAQGTRSVNTNIADTETFVKSAKNAANSAKALVNAASNAVQYAMRAVFAMKYGNVEGIIEKAKDIAQKAKDTANSAIEIAKTAKKEKFSIKDLQFINDAEKCAKDAKKDAKKYLNTMENCIKKDYNEAKGNGEKQKNGAVKDKRSCKYGAKIILKKLNLSKITGSA